MSPMVHSAIKWADSSPLQIRTYLRGLLADLWQIRRVYFSCGLERTCCGLRRSLPWIHHKYAAEQWTYFSKNKFWSAGFCCGLMSAGSRTRCGFTKTVCRGSAPESSVANFLRVLGSAKSPLWRFHSQWRNYRPCCPRTAGGRRFRGAQNCPKMWEIFRKT